MIETIKIRKADDASKEDEDQQ